MRNLTILIFIILLSVQNVISQTIIHKNKLSLQPGYMVANYSELEDFNALDIVSKYQRRVVDRLYISLGYGIGHFQGNEFPDGLSKDEKTFFNLTTLQFGLALEVFRRNNFIIATESYMIHKRYDRVTGTFFSNDSLIDRTIGRANTGWHLVLGLQMENKVSEHLSWITNFGYMPEIRRSEMIRLNTGLAFSF